MSLYDVDVLIVGAGPVGMSVALALHDMGYSVQLIDKQKNRLGFSRAILVNRSTLALLKPFGVADKIIAQGRPLRKAVIHSASGVLLESSWTGADDDTAILLPQLDTESCLEKSLNERGVYIERPLALIGLLQDDEGVTARLSHDGLERTVRSRYLVGADGFHSTTRDALNIAFPTRKLSSQFISLDVKMDWPFDADGAMWLADKGVFGAIRISTDTFRLIGASTAVLDDLLSHFKIKQELWRATFDVYFANVEEYGRGRVWLAGDATHVHSPAGGRGMNMGIADGLALARAIHTGDFDGYVAQRAPIARDWVKKNERITRLLMSDGANGRWVRRGVRLLMRSANNVSLGGLSRSLIEMIAH